MRNILPAAPRMVGKVHEVHAKSGFFRSARHGVNGDVKKRGAVSVARVLRGVSNEVAVGSCEISQIVFVIPAKAGIQSGWPFESVPDLRQLIPAVAGMTQSGVGKIS